MNIKDQRTLFELTQDGLVIGEKIQRIYPQFDVSGFVADVRTEMEGQTILALLETLKDDPDARVREQVATDMRDIIKDFPEAGYATLERWNQDGKPETQKILKQALKYQVKIGDKRAFKLLGLGAVPKLGKADIVLTELQSERLGLSINDAFRFSFSFELEVNGDVFGGFDFEVTAPKNRKELAHDR